MTSAVPQVSVRCNLIHFEGGHLSMPLPAIKISCFKWWEEQSTVKGWHYFRVCFRNQTKAVGSIFYYISEAYEFAEAFQQENPNDEIGIIRGLYYDKHPVEACYPLADIPDLHTRKWVRLHRERLKELQGASNA